MNSAKTSPAGTWRLNFDGGSIGNPGPSAGAAILVNPRGEVSRASEFLERATNNQAEYAGLICGLNLALAAGAERLLVRGDSKLVVCQFTGEWRAKEPAMQECLARAKAAARPFDAVEISWIPREENGEADREVRRCLDGHVLGAVAAQASFQDLAKIRVGGRDRFSRMQREGLLAALGDGADDAARQIASALLAAAGDREKLELTALRWAARGLSPAQAAQKVLVDLEIGRNAAKRR